MVIEPSNLAGHMAFQNKNYISQPPLQPRVVMRPSSGQWDTSGGARQQHIMLFLRFLFFLHPAA